MIIVDIETTGLDPKKHSIVSIGALDFNDIKNQFYEECQIWPGAETDPKALEINGLSKVEIIDKNKKTCEQIISKFLDWVEKIKDKTIAGSNPGFDRDFLKAAVKRFSKNWKFGYHTVDLYSICYAYFLRNNLKIPKNFSTDTIIDYVGLPARGKHNALEDVKYEAEAFSRLIYGKNLIKEFEEFKIPMLINAQ